MLLVFGTEPRNIETGIGAAPLIIGTIVITKVRVITIIVSIVAIVAVHYLINHTRRGRAMRAVFQQKEAAALVGIPISQTYRFTRSEEHTSELQSLMRISYAVFCLKKKKQENSQRHDIHNTSYN